MRLLRLEGEGFAGRAIDLHPSVSVVGELDADLRARLVAAIAALPAGSSAACRGLVEAHDVLLDLDDDALALLGLDAPAEVVIGPPEGVDEAPEESTLDALRGPLEETRRTRDRLAEAELEALSDLEEAREHLDPFAKTAHEQALVTWEAVAGPVDDPDGADSLVDLEERRDALVAEIAEHEAAEPGRVEEALARAERWSGHDPLAEEARALAAELAQLDREMIDLDAALDEDERNPLELARARDALSVEVARLEAQAKPPTVHPDDRDALETAHEEVVEAQARVAGSLLGGRSAQRRLEDAVAAEEAVLDRIGLPTYSAYVMSLTIGSTDPQTEAELYDARQALARAQDELEAATVALQEDPVRRTIGLRLDEIVTRAGELLGRDPGPDVAGALDRFRRERLDSTPLDDLRHELERQQVLAPGMDLGAEDLTDLARAWLAELDDVGSGLEERRAEVRSLEARIDERRARTAEPEGPPPAERVALDEAEARLARHLEAADRVAELTEVLQEVEEKRAELDRSIHAQQSVLEAAEQGAAEQGAAAEDGADDEAALSPALTSAVEALHERVGELEDRSYAGSVPAVVDGLFAGLDREDADLLLGEIEELAERVQIVIMDDDVAIASWATAVGLDRAAVIAPE